MKSIRTYSTKVSLDERWKVFFEALGQAVFTYQTYQSYQNATLWLVNAKIFVAVKEHKQKAHSPTAKEELLSYQEKADHTGFPVICIKGLPQTNRYSIRLFAPRSSHRFHNFYWATFAIGEGDQLCLIEGEKFMYLQGENLTENSKIPDRHSHLIIKALDYASHI